MLVLFGLSAVVVAHLQPRKRHGYQAISVVNVCCPLGWTAVSTKWTGLTSPFGPIIAFGFMTLYELPRSHWLRCRLSSLKGFSFRGPGNRLYERICGPFRPHGTQAAR